MTLAIPCADFTAGRCRSCERLPEPYASQLATKDRDARALLDPSGQADWRPPVAGRIAGFRNKAKFAVTGSAEAPRLGLPDGTDLGDCPLYPLVIREALAALRRLIGAARILPYDIAARRGELKYLLISCDSAEQRLLLRFVLRSTEALPRLRKALPALLAELPALAVVSANLQPEPKAILEGPTEILLSESGHLPLAVNGIPLQLTPQAFFQTHPDVAAALYAHARDWIGELEDPIRRAADLYCGIGGFALHLAPLVGEMLGIERSTAAVTGATSSAAAMGLRNTRFLAGDVDATLGALAPSPELLIVNPPRRGLDPGLRGWIRQQQPRWLLYSSCNPATLARDLADLTGYRLLRAQVHDMFPHTGHYEVLALVGASQT